MTEISPVMQQISKEVLQRAEDELRRLRTENHELRRTRSEAEAAAEVKGFKAGIAEGERRLRALLRHGEDVSGK